MSYLYDKVTARYVLQGLRKISDGQRLTPDEKIALDFFSIHRFQNALYIVPATYNILMRLYREPRYQPMINLFLNSAEIVYPTKYNKRWARRLREHTFTREDASVLALATFGTTDDLSLFGIQYVLTFDKHMINNWQNHYSTIHEQLKTMKRDLAEPYCKVSLPQVLRPDQL